jgi:hypothetical protein
VPTRSVRTHSRSAPSRSCARATWRTSGNSPAIATPEPENLETVGHHDGAVHTRQIGYQVGHLEQRFVHVAQMLRTTRFVGVPSNRRTVGSFITGELVHDVSHESHDPSAGLLIGEAVLHAHISPVLEQLGHTAVRHYNQCSPMLRGRPPAQTSTTFKRAPKAAGKVGKTSPLDFEKTDPDQPF